MKTEGLPAEFLLYRKEYFFINASFAIRDCLIIKSKSNQIQKTMKTYLKVFFVATLTVFFFSQGYAQTTEKSASDKPATGTAVMGKFVDANNNGICDNHEMKANANQCANFVDKDGNGICDNCPKNANGGQNANCQGNQNGKNCVQGQANCCGRGSGAGRGQGRCCANQQATPAVTPVETPEPKK